MEYSYVVNPNTGEKYNMKSKDAKDLIKKYVNYLKNFKRTGGSSSESSSSKVDSSNITESTGIDQPIKYPGVESSQSEEQTQQLEEQTQEQTQQLEEQTQEQTQDEAEDESEAQPDSKDDATAFMDTRMAELAEAQPDDSESETREKSEIVDSIVKKLMNFVNTLSPENLELLDEGLNNL